jgi:putative transposase
MLENTTQQPLLPFHLFDPDADVLIIERRLPHWSQAGAVCFLTWRTNDSMPKDILDGWFGDRGRWLAKHGIRADDPRWKIKLARLDPAVVRAFLDKFWNRWHDDLDACHGRCVLRRPELATIVANSLLHFDGERYEILDYVVMPNHVHVLAAFANEEAMLAQCESWKHYTSVQINRRLGEKGRFWQTDGFDHLVRTAIQFEYLRNYIRDNPRRARLRTDEYLHYSKDIS